MTTLGVHTQWITRDTVHFIYLTWLAVLRLHHTKITRLQNSTWYSCCSIYRLPGTVTAGAIITSPNMRATNAKRHQHWHKQ